MESNKKKPHFILLCLLICCCWFFNFFFLPVGLYGDKLSIPIAGAEGSGAGAGLAVLHITSKGGKTRSEQFPLLCPDISVFGACSPFDPRLSPTAKNPGYSYSRSNEGSTSVFSWCPVATAITFNRGCGLPCVSVVLMLKWILIMSPLFLVATMWFFF